MTTPLVSNPDRIRLAMIGMVEGNGHPYSWSAIINGGFDRQTIAESAYPAIEKYLSAEPKENLGIPGVRVTHIWCDSRKDAEHVSRGSIIPNVLNQPTDAIGLVDAVVIPTDKPEEHLDRARPFIEAGLPVFIDKPLTDQEDHLRQFIHWQKDGRPILSSSCMRYAREFIDLRTRLSELGTLRLLVISMCKSWERYGIHALEAVYPFVEPGAWVSVRHSGDERANIVHVRHGSGVEVVLSVIADLYGAFGHLTAYGTQGVRHVPFADTFSAFKAQLETFVSYLRTGIAPIDFVQTIELMKIIIAGKRSRSDGGREVLLSEIQV